MHRPDIPLALTLGDPAGIGPDLALAAWWARDVEYIPLFVFLGDPDLLAARAEQLGVSIPIAVIDKPSEAERRFAEALPVLPITVAGKVVPGRSDKAAMPAVIQSIERAVELVQAGEASAVVTNPVSKAALYRSGFAFPGHTEFLATLGRRETPAAPTAPVMMLVAKDLRVVPTTIHIPLKHVPITLTQDLILSTIMTTAAGLKKYFALANPHIAVTGLNPHAGEEGNMGREEIDIIVPAIERARRKGITVTGPHSADTLFHAEARKAYNAVVTMYHDQALIPVKTLGFDEGVNVTLGLPFVRTSPDHGTAFQLAGTGNASPRSLIEALRLADKMWQTARTRR
ncbi:MAG: 4-hydroxythreonine-4-phosphate dehydrogenase PdxA [Methyloceanibacter sp.]|nr:4-hydroxythreonine-4-phosphate dehydrogenase PdxA [Methyloceanibacter sp.]